MVRMEEGKWDRRDERKFYVYQILHRQEAEHSLVGINIDARVACWMWGKNLGITVKPGSNSYRKWRKPDSHGGQRKYDGDSHPQTRACRHRNP